MQFMTNHQNLWSLTKNKLFTSLNRKNHKLPPVLSFKDLCWFFAFVNTTKRTIYLETKMAKFVTMEMKRALALTMVTMGFCFWWQLFLDFDIDNGDNGCWCPCNLQTCPGIGGLNLKWMQAGLCEPQIWRKVIIVVRGHQNFVLWWHLVKRAKTVRYGIC